MTCVTSAHVEYAHVLTSFSYPANCWTDCAEIWDVVRDPLARRFRYVNGGLPIQVHVRTLFPHLGNGWMECCAEIRCVVRGLLSARFTQGWGISARAYVHMYVRVTVHTFKHIYLLTLVHCTKASYWYIIFMRFVSFILLVFLQILWIKALGILL